MNNSVTAPWLAEIVLITWRAYSKYHRPPVPSELLASFIVYGALGFVPNDRVGAAAGWGFFIASALNILPSIVDPASKAKSSTLNNSIGPSGSTGPVTQVGPGTAVSAPNGPPPPGYENVTVPGVGTFQIPIPK